MSLKNVSLLHSYCSPPSRASTLEGRANVHLCTPYTKQSNLNFQTKKNLEVKASLNLHTPLLLLWRFFPHFLKFWDLRNLNPCRVHFAHGCRMIVQSCHRRYYFLNKNRTAGKEVSFLWGNKIFQLEAWFLGRRSRFLMIIGIGPTRNSRCTFVYKSILYR